MKRRGMQAGSGVDHIPAVQSCNVFEESQSGLQRHASVSERHFEDPLPVVSYTRARGGLRRSQSLDDDQMRDYPLLGTEAVDSSVTKEEPA